MQEVSKDPDLEEIEILIDPTDPEDYLFEQKPEVEEIEQLDEDWPYPDEDEVDYTTGCPELKMQGLPYYL